MCVKIYSSNLIKKLFDIIYFFVANYFYLYISLYLILCNALAK